MQTGKHGAQVRYRIYDWRALPISMRRINRPTSADPSPLGFQARIRLSHWLLAHRGERSSLFALGFLKM